ncbi:MAG: hypothetical protein QXG03_02770 [Halalkalicoccus sp.]
MCCCYLTDVREASSDPEALCPIYGWSSEPVDCERCGEATIRWWRDDGRVCPACVDWTRTVPSVGEPE